MYGSRRRATEVAAASSVARQADDAHCVRAARQRVPRFGDRARRRALRPRVGRRGRPGTGKPTHFVFYLFYTNCIFAAFSRTISLFSFENGRLLVLNFLKINLLKIIRKLPF